MVCVHVLSDIHVMLCAAAPVKASESKNKVSAAAAAPSSTTPATPAKADTPAVTAAAEYVVPCVDLSNAFRCRRAGRVSNPD